MKPSNPPYLGAAYYPEDWPIEQIDDDIALMKAAGTNIMRIAEFAWSRMEPDEGKYDFDWLHLVVEKLGAAGISVIMCTPTCTPPIWLIEKHPETLFVREDGAPVYHGARRHACPNSPVYRDHCARIVTKMAEEFGQDDRIIGWQIDNEVSPIGRGRSCV
ncbi:MAG: beta-galactosidase, partial [Armatimonadetes bacterium]|nr:beta-galactosidase [Armatimonadota bacterium]